MYKEILLEHQLSKMGDQKLRNVIMQLRKVCLHPYLFKGVENLELDPQGAHLVESCSKMKILDALLHRLKNEDRKVLLFSQFTTMLDILEDYCIGSGFTYCRLDGSKSKEQRTNAIDSFQNVDQDNFIFLLSTRAGGLGINLAIADTVILYDSDWNPQMDLQAMDRAHRLGQTNCVNVYRLIC